jgi:hypothetical protein
MTDTIDARRRVYRCPGPAGNRPSAARAHQLVHAAHPQVTQIIKRTNHTYFVLDDYICALRTAKEHVNGFLYYGGTARAQRGSSAVAITTRPTAPVAILHGEAVNAPALKAMSRQIIPGNRVGRQPRAQATRRPAVTEFGSQPADWARIDTVPEVGTSSSRCAAEGRVTRRAGRLPDAARKYGLAIP